MHCLFSYHLILICTNLQGNFVSSCHPQLWVRLQAYRQSSSPISAQIPQAMPFRWLKVQKRSSILCTPQEPCKESSVRLFSVGVSPPRARELLHVRGPSLGTSLHKCPSPEVSPSLHIDAYWACAYGHAGGELPPTWTAPNPSAQYPDARRLTRRAELGGLGASIRRLQLESAIGLNQPGRNLKQALDCPGLFQGADSLALRPRLPSATDNFMHCVMRVGCARLFVRGCRPLCKGIKSTLQPRNVLQV